MLKLKIKEPIWKNQSVGIASFRAIDDLEITIAYADKYGNKRFPGKYYIKKEDIIKYPIQFCRGIKLHIVPIEELSRNGQTN